jgi:hypothetical protein
MLRKSWQWTKHQSNIKFRLWCRFFVILHDYIKVSLMNKLDFFMKSAWSKYSIYLINATITELETNHWNQVAEMIECENVSVCPHNQNSRNHSGRASKSLIEVMLSDLDADMQVNRPDFPGLFSHACRTIGSPIVQWDNMA